MGPLSYLHSCLLKSRRVWILPYYIDSLHQGPSSRSRGLFISDQRSTRRCSGNHFSRHFSQKKKLNFWTNAPFRKFYNMIVKTSQQWFNINGKNAFGCPLRLGLYLKVECMNLSETNFSRTAESQRLWQGAICHVWTSQFDKHWRHSQKQRLAYKLVDEKRR